jgi:hypothetical protein
MAEQKTKPHEASVRAFIEAVEDPKKREDSWKILDCMQKVTGKEPVMWGPSIIGFGHYHYKYPSGHEGDAPTLGFSPRKAAISLYVFTGLEEHAHLLEGLGKYKMGKACIYIRRWDDINEEALVRLMNGSLDYLKKTYTVL